MIINFLDELKKVVKEAGQIALNEQSSLITTIKSDKSVVSNGDISTSLFLVKKLKNMFPDWDILSEESPHEHFSKNKTIVIDPIDGTESYIRKEDTWAILIGFMEDDVITGGIIYQPTKNFLYYGFKNCGAFLETNTGVTKIQADKQDQNPLIGLMSVKDNGEMNFLFDDLKMNSIIKSYSASLKIMEIAKGNANVYANFRKKCSIWDLVAPIAILNEANGVFKSRNRTSVSINQTHFDDDFIVLSMKNSKISLPNNPNNAKGDKN